MSSCCVYAKSYGELGPFMKLKTIMSPEVDCLQIHNSAPLPTPPPASMPLEIWLCTFSHLGLESISSPLESGPASGIALANRSW